MSSKLLMSLIVTFVMYSTIFTTVVSLNCPTSPVLTIKLNSNHSMENVTKFINESYKNIVYFKNITKLINEDYNVVYFKNITNITMTCSAQHPILIDILRKMPQPVKQVIFQRVVGNFSNKSTYCYKVKLQFNTYHTTTGNYICREIMQNSKSSSSIYIMANGDTGGTLLNAGEEGTEHKVGIPNDFGWIEIPCIFTNPMVIPKLYWVKDIPRNIRIQVEIGPTARYIPTIGFLLNAASVNGTRFECMGSTQKMTFRIGEIDGDLTFVRVFPVIKKLTVKNETILICDSNKPIRLLLINNQKIMMNEQHFKSRTNSFFKFRVTMKITLSSVEKIHGNDKVSVECQLSSTGRQLHTWTYDQYSNNNETGVGHITFNRHPFNSRFICRTQNGTSPQIWFIECDNPINCLIAKNFSYLITNNWSPEGQFPFPTKEGYPCSRNILQETFYGTEKSGCALMPYEQLKRHGLIKCKESDPDYEADTLYTYFISAFTQQIVTVNYLEQPTFIDTQGILQITLNKENQTLHVDQDVQFECRASSFIFATGIQIRFFLTDGSTIAKDNPLVRKWSSNEKEKSGIIVYNLTATMSSRNISKVYCFAPYWNTEDWANVSKNLQVEDIKIVKGSIEIFYLKEQNKSIHCEGMAVLPQEIKWYKDDQEITKEGSVYNVSIFFTHHRSTILFPVVKEFHSGLYKCKITNAKGIWTKTFEVKVNSSDGPIILYVIIGCGVLVLAIVILVFLRILKKQRTTIEELTEAEIHEFHYGNEDLARRYVELHENARYLPYQQEYEIPKHKLEISNEMLGTGTFGIVSKGHLLKNGNKTPVAIKTARSDSNITYLKTLLSEIKIMMWIGNHPNIIKLLGAITKDLREGKLQVVVEFCYNGSLQDFLRKNRDTFVNQVFQNELDCGIETLRPRSQPVSSIVQGESSKFIKHFSRTSTESRKSTASKFNAIGTLDLIRWSYQTANGMEYLVQKKVIHGDLAARNLLLNSNWVIKITDFGLSRHLYEYTNYIKKSKEEPVPWRWLSTEAFRDSKFSSDSDVWAYGITLWEIFTLSEVPYQGFSWGEEFVNKLYNGYRLSQPQYSSLNIYELMQQCWQVLPEQRPSFTVLKEKFHKILTKQTKTKNSS